MPCMKSMMGRCNKAALAAAAEEQHRTDSRTDELLREHMGPVQSDTRVQARVKAVLNELHCKRAILLQQQEDEAVNAAALALFEKQLAQTEEASPALAPTHARVDIDVDDSADDTAPAPAPAHALARAPAP